MRVRESKPSVDAALAYIGEEAVDSIGMIAKYHAVSDREVIRWYLSKVGTWRQGEGSLPPLPAHSLSRSEVRRIWIQTERHFWEQAHTQLEGAPEWLREEFIMRWQEWLKPEAWYDNQPALEELEYVHQVLAHALTSDHEPKDLP